MKFEKTVVLACILALFAAFGCGDDDAATDAGTDADSDTDSDAGVDGGEFEDYEITGTVTVPDGFDGTPVMIQFAFYDAAGGFPSVPGMPDGLGTADEEVAIDADTPYEFTTYARAFGEDPVLLADGEYYVAAVLYCEGGAGSGIPTPDVDWYGASGTVVTLPAETSVDVGPFELSLYTAE